LAGLALIERVERINVKMVCPMQRARFVQQNPYAIEVDHANRNCYNCGGFGYLARNCRNRRTKNRIGEGRRLEYKEKRRIKEGNKQSSNLNGKEDLIVFN